MHYELKAETTFTPSVCTTYHVPHGHTSHRVTQSRSSSDATPVQPAIGWPNCSNLALRLWEVGLSTRGLSQLRRCVRRVTATHKLTLMSPGVQLHYMVREYNNGQSGELQDYTFNLSTAFETLMAGKTAPPLLVDCADGTPALSRVSVCQFSSHASC